MGGSRGGAIISLWWGLGAGRGLGAGLHFWGRGPGGGTRSPRRSFVRADRTDRSPPSPVPVPACWSRWPRTSPPTSADAHAAWDKFLSLVSGVLTEKYHRPPQDPRTSFEPLLFPPLLVFHRDPNNG